MHLLFRFALWLLHFLYSIHLALSSIRSRYLRSTPRSLTATRSKTPSHLALVLASQEPELCVSEAREALLACTERAVAYCRVAGIRCLSVYDRQGILLNAFDVAEERLEKCLPPTQDQFSQAEAVFPLTPPLSDDSDVSDGSNIKGRTYPKTIRSGDTTERRRKRSGNRPAIQRHRMLGPSNSEDFMLQFVSRDTGKPTIAAVADSLLRSVAHRSPRKVKKEVEELGISVPGIEAILEGGRGYKAPDLTIVHHVTVPRRQCPPLELHSFPPWQLRLTEIYHNGFTGSRDRWLRAKVSPRDKTWTLLSELDVRRALDEYSSAEFRLGK